MNFLRPRLYSLIAHGSRVLALALLGLALAGCVTSRRPLFPEAAAVPALGNGGRYATFEATEQGIYKPDEIMIVRRRGSGYDFIDRRGNPTAVTFYPLKDRSFIGQMNAGGDYAYVRLDVADGAAYLRAADCNKQDREKLAALGVSFRSAECVFDNVRDPAAAFAALDFGPPTSKMELAAEQTLRRRHGPRRRAARHHHRRFRR